MKTIHTPLQDQNDIALGLLKFLDGRRKELGMSMRVVAERSGLGMRTVQRVLAGKEPTAKLTTVLLIADALKIALRPKDTVSAHVFRRNQALAKAAKISAMVQANSALEAQAVPKNALRELRDEMAGRLIAGSRRQLWA